MVDHLERKIKRGQLYFPCVTERLTDRKITGTNTQREGRGWGGVGEYKHISRDQTVDLELTIVHEPSMTVLAGEKNLYYNYCDSTRPGR